MKYFVGIAIASVLLIALGFMLFSGGGALVVPGFFVLIFGILVIYAGSLGVLYKVIADGVEQGYLSAERA